MFSEIFDVFIDIFDVFVFKTMYVLVLMCSYYVSNVRVLKNDHLCDGWTSGLTQSVLLAKHSSMCALISALSAFDENS